MSARASSKPVRQIDIARAVGVSQRAVSVVLGQSDSHKVRVAPATARRINETAARMGYQPHIPAQQMKGKRSGMIGVLIGAAEAEANYQRLSRMEWLARQRGYRFMVGHVRSVSDLDHYAADFQARMMEGALCLRHEMGPSKDTDPAVSRALADMPNVVYLDPPVGVADPWYVKLDRCEGIRQGIAHLVDRGRQRIAIVLSSPRDPQAQSLPMRDRLQGYREGLAAADRPIDPDLIWTDVDLAASDHRARLLERAVDDLVVAHRADAILASNDETAITLIRQIKARSYRVPQDVAVVGYDNLSFAGLVEPSLTTLDPDHDRAAKLMMDLLIARMRGEDVPPQRRQVTVKPKLIVRDST